MDQSRFSNFRSRNQMTRKDKEKDYVASPASAMVGLDTSRVCNFGAIFGSRRSEVKQEEKEQDYDASLSAAMVAANLISSARFILKQDSVYTKYSAQYLVDNACPKKENREGEETKDHKCCNFKLTVKDALKFALKEGIPKIEDWIHLGCRFKRPSLPCYAPPLVSLKGKVIEPKKLEQVFECLVHQPIGARLHVFTPEIDCLGDGIYKGGRSSGTSYVGLRDVIIFEIEQDEKTTTATVKFCYKKKESFIKVSMNAMFLHVPGAGEDESQVIKPTGLLVDYCLPRFSK